MRYDTRNERGIAFDDVVLGLAAFETLPGQYWRQGSVSFPKGFDNIGPVTSVGRDGEVAGITRSLDGQSGIFLKILQLPRLFRLFRFFRFFGLSGFLGLFDFLCFFGIGQTQGLPS